MEGLMICIFIIIVLACAIAVFYATIYNKFQEYIIRINEVESMIDTYLRNKYDLINKSIPIIKGNIKSEKEIFGEIVKLRSRKIGNPPPGAGTAPAFGRSRCPWARGYTHHPHRGRDDSRPR